jgi:hypothetical protein
MLSNSNTARIRKHDTPMRASVLYWMLSRSAIHPTASGQYASAMKGRPSIANTSAYRSRSL